MYPDKSRPFPGILYLAAVERFTAAPRPGNTINIIVNAVFNAFDFKAIQAAIICNAFPAFTILSFIHHSNPLSKWHGVGNSPGFFKRSNVAANSVCGLK